MTAFRRYQLRTKDLRAAQAFYDDVLGRELWGEDVWISPLPERAAAQGVPSHWLGHIATDDVQATAARVVAAGGQSLGPAGPGTALVRDPFGAVLALTAPPAGPGRAPVQWHVLAAADEERAFAWYAALFGWSPTGVLRVGREADCRTFAWDRSGRSVGSTTNAARLPGVHPHWLFHFVVDDIERRLAAVRRHGGKVIGPHPTSAGDLVAPCDDPQGAAFALIQLGT